ncbi:hypothetical protein RHECNPAF_430083 [Rhizobium etli CNPAF512]|nr:hypothetical protein RHECNPAF_430083 [Rhizobium etli CNPAF512]
MNWPPRSPTERIRGQTLLPGSSCPNLSDTSPAAIAENSLPPVAGSACREITLQIVDQRRPADIGRIFMGGAAEVLKEIVFEFVIVMRDIDARPVDELADGRKLMIVSVFAKGCLAGDENDRFAETFRGEHGADARVRDDHARLAKDPVEVGRVDILDPFHVLGRVRALADLRQNRLGQFFGEGVDRFDEAIERQLRSDGDQNQRTAPA